MNAMQFKTSKAEFLRSLRLAMNVSNRKGTMPMLACVLLRVGRAGKLTVAATDLDIGITSEIPVQIGSSDGSLAVNAKSLHDIVSGLPGDQVSVTGIENNWCEIKAGKVSYKIVGVPARDFPKMAESEDAIECEVDAVMLLEMIDRTLFSVCSDETRFHLNGVFFESTGTTARMVSTDGHRLSKVERPLVGPKLSHGIIIPRKGCIEIKRLLDGAKTCVMGFRSPRIFIATTDAKLSVKLIDAQFPPFEAVIPKEHSRTIVVDRHLFTDAVRRGHLMASEVRGIVVDLTSDGVTISSDSPDVGSVTEAIDADCRGEPVRIGFNPRYLSDILAHIQTDQVALELGGELDPGVVKPVGADEFLGVIMPMRV